jgi:hypothetical protein
MSPRAAAIFIVVWGLALLSSTIGPGAVAAERSLVELLSRAGEYVLAYEDEFRVVIAEEVYVQRLRTAPGGPVRETRRLRSDVAFVRVSGTGLPWWLLRDVYEVDGQLIRDRQARLERVLIENPATGLARARAIADEGARFNVGRSELVVDLPGDGVRTRATVATEYRPYQALALWVPVEMRDRLQVELASARGRSGGVEFVEGVAAYSGFRKASVTTQEEFRVAEPDPR